MAKRLCFIATPKEKNLYKEIEIDFKYFSGFAVSQKQKSIKALHESIAMLNPELRVLEVSTKSTNPIGVKLSAFNLKFYNERLKKEFPLENIFQSSKVFQKGGPYLDLLDVKPKDAKKDKRLQTSGELKYFQHNNEIWELEPKTMFYDWIYINALIRDQELVNEVIKYDCFTDIEFKGMRVCFYSQ